MRVLIAGLGGIGQRHARNLRTLLGDDLELLAFRTRGTAPVLTERMGVETGADLESKLSLRTFTDLQTALAERPDAVIIANPTSLHLSTAIAAAEAGCHLFIEKPLSHSWEGVPQFLEEVARKQLVTFVGYQWRFHPLLERVRELLDAHVAGRIISVLAKFGEYLPGWHPYEDYRESYAARRELGGGVLLTQIHDFDYLGWLFGWPRRLFCVGGKLSSLEVDVEDTASTLLDCEYEGERLPVHLHQDYVQRQPVRNCEIIGEQATISIDLARTRLVVRNDNGVATAPVDDFDTFERNQIFLAEMEHFLACVRGEANSRISAAEAARSLQVALAAQKSLQTGELVEL